MWHCLPIFFVSVGCMLCNNVTTNKARAALSFLIVLVIILCGTLHGKSRQHCTFRTVFADPKSDVNYFYKWNIENF